MSQRPLLSVMVPAITSRFEMLKCLLTELERQAAGQPVEVLSLLDNKRRSIGLKRQALLDVARGEYVAFVDDDDEVAPTYVADVLAALANARPSVVVFNQLSFIEDWPPVVIQFGLEFENQEVQLEPKANRSSVFTRKPWHVCPWRADIAKRCVFPDASYGEDWWWAAQCNKLAVDQVRIGKLLHTYRYKSTVTAADPVFPIGEPPEPLPACRT